MGGARPPRRRGVVPVVTSRRQRLAAAAATAATATIATAAVLLGGVPAAAAPAPSAAVTLSAPLAVRQQQARQGTSWSFTPDGRRTFRIRGVCAETGLCKAEYRYPCLSDPSGTCTRTVSTRCVWRCVGNSPSGGGEVSDVTVPDVTAGSDSDVVLPTDAVDGDELDVDGDDVSAPVLSTLQVDGGSDEADSGASAPVTSAVSPVAGEPTVVQPEVPVSDVPSDVTVPGVTVGNDEDALVPTDAAVEDAFEPEAGDDGAAVLPTQTLPTGGNGNGSDDGGAPTVSNVSSGVSVPGVTDGNDLDALVPTDAAVEDALEAEADDVGATVLPTGGDGNVGDDGGASTVGSVPSDVTAPEVTADSIEDAVLPSDAAVEDVLEVEGGGESVLPTANVDEAELTTDPVVDEPELTADPAVEAADPTEVPEAAEDEAAPSDFPSSLPYTFGDGIRTCTLDTVRTRRDIRTYSSDELSALTSAWAALYASSTLTDFTAIHVAAHHVAHGGAAFLPWHTLFLLELEAALRSISPGLALPYWPWAADAEDLAAAPVWSASAFGRANSGNCIVDGNFFGVTGSRGRCVLRGFTSISGGIPPVAVVQQGTIDEAVMAAGGGYAAFAAAAESFHNELHVSLSGDMAVGYSPDDPTFWAHHAYVDSWWAARREWSPNEFGGTHRGVPVSTTNTLWPYNVTIADAMALPCVRYAPLLDASTVSRQAETETTPDVDRAEVEALVARREAIVGPPSIEFAVRMGDDRETAVAGRTVAVAVQVEAAVSGTIDVSAYERVEEPPVVGRFNGSEDVARGPDGVPVEPVPVLYAGSGGDYTPRPTKEVVGQPAYPPASSPAYPPTVAPAYASGPAPTYPPVAVPTYPPVAVPTYPPVAAPAYPPVAEPTYASQEVPVYAPVAVPTYSSQEASAYSTQQVPAYPVVGGVASDVDAVPTYAQGEVPTDNYSYPGSAPDHTACVDDIDGGEADLESSDEPTESPTDEVEGDETAAPADYEVTWTGGDPYGTDTTAEPTDPADGGSGAAATPAPYPTPVYRNGDATPTPFNGPDSEVEDEPASTASPSGVDSAATPEPYSGPYDGVEDEAAATASPYGVDSDATPAPYSGPYDGVEDESAATPSPSFSPYGSADEPASATPATLYEYRVGGTAPATTAVPYAAVASATPALYGGRSDGGSPTPTREPYGDDDGNAPAVTTGAAAYDDNEIDVGTAATPSPSAGSYRPAAEAALAAPAAPYEYGTEGPTATAIASPYAPVASVAPVPYGDAVGGGLPVGTTYVSVHE
ncbi:hypothetical protein I4F81_009721 [Pyropia yezoensis]|uniref:Uncharacterized protein n=1 Tax=Pyropia yezoensis TaxID=2788 RepID=A0ACC3CAB6_PYRYE|nr:hypothetical protein I4F81_009721 [Neopyropia yezoensis]